MAKEGKAYVLTDAEIEQFKTFLSTKRHADRNLAIYLLTRRAGLRIGEVSQLKLSDVIDAKGQLKNIATLRSKITKGNKTRTAYLNHPELKSALSKYLSARPKYKTDSLFVSQKGVPFTPKSMSKIINQLYLEAGFDGASSHSGRRGAASSMLATGLDIVALSRFLGHSDITTTQEYIEVDQDRLMNAVEAA